MSIPTWPTRVFAMSMFYVAHLSVVRSKASRIPSAGEGRSLASYGRNNMGDGSSEGGQYAYTHPLLLSGPNEVCSTSPLTSYMSASSGISVTLQIEIKES